MAALALNRFYLSLPLLLTLSKELSQIHSTEVTLRFQIQMKCPRQSIKVKTSLLI